MNLPSATGDAGLDFALEAGPRALTPDTPVELLKEIGKYECFSPLREAMKRLKLRRREIVLAAIDRTARENRLIEQLPHRNPNLLPKARIPIELVHELEAQEKDSWSAEMREDTLRCHPELRLNINGA
jgi:hypothetical protein